MLMNRKAIIPIFLAVTLLQGCSFFKRDAATARRSCKEERAMLDDRNLPLLAAPAGLEAPDPRLAIAIPPLNEPERPRSAGDPCLSQPPSYKTAQTVSPPSAARSAADSSSH